MGEYLAGGAVVCGNCLCFAVVADKTGVLLAREWLGLGALLVWGRSPYLP